MQVSKSVRVLLDRAFVLIQAGSISLLCTSCGGDDDVSPPPPAPPPQHYVYASNGQALAAAALNSSGELAVVERRTGFDLPTGLAAHPDGKTLFVGDAGFGQPRILQYAIINNGTLQSVAATPSVASRQLAIDSRGAFLLAAGARGGQVTAYRVASNTHALSLSGLLGGEADITPRLVIDPLARFVYVHWAVSGPFGVNPHLDTYAADPATGALSFLGKRTENIPNCLVIAPNGIFAFGIGNGTGELQAFSVGATGELTLTQAAGRQGSCAMAVSPDGARLVVARGIALEVYAIATMTGALTFVAAAPLPAEVMPSALAFSGAGFVVTLLVDGRLASYRIDASGAPALIDAVQALDRPAGGAAGAVVAVIVPA